MKLRVETLNGIQNKWNPDKLQKYHTMKNVIFHTSKGLKMNNLMLLRVKRKERRKLNLHLKMRIMTMMSIALMLANLIIQLMTMMKMNMTLTTMLQIGTNKMINNNIKEINNQAELKEMMSHMINIEADDENLY